MSNQVPIPGTGRKVLLVEDSLRMQEILTWSLQTVPGLELAAVADTVTDALMEFERHQPEVVILDLVLRGGSGLDVLRELKQRAPACQVLVFTTHDSEPYRVRCLTEGADHFFSKNKQHRELVQLLQQLGKHAGSGLNSQPRSDNV